MNRLIIALIVLSFLGCRHSDKDIICVNFRSVTNCDNNGIPRDSFTYYFPPELFTDTILGFYDGKNIHCLKDISKTSYSKISGQKVETLKDTCEIKFDSLSLKINSYMLFKMNEPLLYSHYLNKDVYRLTTRSFGTRSPLVITIEKYKDSVVLISKKLNREIRYPFIKVGGVILFYDPKFSLFNKKTNKYVITNKKKYDEELEKSREMTDSLSKIYNRCDYYLKANERRI
ncbi:MAG TPA: hypothetical protein VFK73_06905, partial [Paludibacter sp.]|nr:hypothetical protein [Paludibacter sp.]